MKNACVALNIGSKREMFTATVKKKIIQYSLRAKVCFKPLTGQMQQASLYAMAK